MAATSPQANTGNLFKDSVISATKQVMRGRADMDKMKLGKIHAIKQLLNEEGHGQQEQVILSSKVVKINRKGLNQDRYLMITNKAIYNLKPKKYQHSQRRVSISKVGMVTLAAQSDEFAIHVTDEYDYHFRSKDKDQICEILQDLYEVEKQGMELVVVCSPKKHLKDIILTKKLAKFEKKEKKSEIKAKLKAKSMANLGAEDYSDEENYQKQKQSGNNPKQQQRQYQQPGGQQPGQPGQGYRPPPQQQQQQQQQYNNQQYQQPQPQPAQNQYNNNQMQYNNQMQPQNGNQYQNNNNNGYGNQYNNQMQQNMNQYNNNQMPQQNGYAQQQMQMPQNGNQYNNNGYGQQQNGNGFGQQQNGNGYNQYNNQY